MKRPTLRHLLAIGGCLVVGALCVVLQISEDAAQKSSATQRGTGTASSSNQILAGPTEVIESVPTAEQKATHTVAADVPRYLSVPQIGIEQARVAATGLDKKGRIGSPVNIHDVAWYTGSAKPAQPGTIFIDGHLSGPNEPGVFSRLTQLGRGDKIQLETGDGHLFTYTVQRIEQLPVDTVDMAQLLSHKEAEKPTLVLMTCGGPFDKQRNTYEDRVIVYATRD